MAAGANTAFWREPAVMLAALLLNAKTHEKLCRLFPYYNSPQWAEVFSLSRLHDHNQSQPHTIGLLWTSNQPDTLTSILQHTTTTTHTLPHPDTIQTHNLSKRAAADQRLVLY